MRVTKLFLTLGIILLIGLGVFKIEFERNNNISESIISKKVNFPVYGRFTVARVVDGDTIDLTNGERVRYIGINAPESTDPKNIQCFGKESAKYNATLVEGKNVFLEKDTSDRDKYGRLLRYVYLDDPAATASARMVNEILVLHGYAASLTIPPDVKYMKRFQAAQVTAKKAKIGLWDHCPVVFR